MEVAWSNLSADCDESVYICVVLRQKLIIWRVVTTANKNEDQMELSLQKVEELQLKPLQRGFICVQLVFYMYM